MAAIQTRPAKVGGLIKKEFWTEEAYCREVLSVDIVNLAVVLGTVVWQNASTGTFGQIPANATAIVAADDRVAVVIDDDYLAIINGATTGNFDLVCMVRGPSVLASGLFTYVGTDAATDTVAEIATNIAIADSMLVTAGVKLESTFSSAQS